MLLVCLTVVTGLVDAFSYLRLGHVFVANMTGNVVFLGFALAGVGRDLDCGQPSRGVGLRPRRGGGWAVGSRPSGAPRAPAGCRHVGSGGRRSGRVRHREHRRCAGSAVRLTLIGLLALAMGGQNAVVRRLAVPDLTTTVLTLTVTGLVADTTSQSVRGRRLISVLAMLAGALTGGVLLRWVALAAPLWLAAVLLVACAAGAFAGGRSPTIADLAVARRASLAANDPAAGIT